MKRILFTLVFFSVWLTSCEEHNNYSNDNITVRGSGELVRHEESLSAISGVSIVGQASVNITSGDKQSVVIRAQQNVYEVLDVHVSGGVLIVGVKDECSIHTDKGIYVDVVTTTGISNVSIVGAGEIRLSGRTQESLEINITGAGSIKAFDLPVDNSKIVISGAGECEVNVAGKLNVIISGTGSVEYKGHPQISQVIAGVGNVSHRN